MDHRNWRALGWIKMANEKGGPTALRGIVLATSAMLGSYTPIHARTFLVPLREIVFSMGPALQPHHRSAKARERTTSY